MFSSLIAKIFGKRVNQYLNKRVLSEYYHLPPITDDEVVDAVRSVPCHYTFTEQLTQFLSIPIASLYPATAGGNNNTLNSTVGPINAKNFKRFMGHMKCGTVGANACTTMVFQSSNANNGTFSDVPSGASVTLSTTNSEGTIEMRSDQIPAGNSWIQLRCQVGTNTNAGNTAVFDASLFAGDAHYRPVAQYDFSTNTSLLNRQVM